jgi:hypothetical protein
MLSWSESGIAITLLAKDVVFVDKNNIQCVVPSGWGWCEIIHTDPQLQSPIVVRRKIILCMQPLLPQLRLAE